MSEGKAIIGQSGGPTAVINKSLVGFIREAKETGFSEVLGARHGIKGMLKEDFVDLTKLSAKYEIEVFSEPFENEDVAIQKLKNFEVLFIMRERTKITSKFYFF